MKGLVLLNPKAIVMLWKLARVCCLLLVTLSLARNWIAEGQGGDCLPLSEENLGNTTTFSQAGLISMALTDNTIQPEVLLLDYNVVCIAQGTMKDRWRMVSGVAQYMVRGNQEPVVKQFHFECESDGSGWTTTVLDSADFVLTVPNATIDISNRTDCALCVSPDQLPGFGADNEHHCVACAVECIGTGLMRCTSQDSSDRCTHFGLGGQCVNGSCPGNSVSNDKFECICPQSYTGPECSVDVNECDLNTNLCANGVNCTNTNGNFTCDCPAGYTGHVCDISIGECDTVPCANGGTCTGNTCSCPPGFAGSLCDMNVTDGCAVNTCMNGGSCMNDSEEFLCLCPTGYTGERCEEGIDLCVNSSRCVNGAECISVGVNETFCNCTAGWSGMRCDVCMLDSCANCSADENQSYAAVCRKCEDGFQLENGTCQLECMVKGCANCLESSSVVCEECENGLTRADNGSSCMAITVLVASTAATNTETTATHPTPSTVGGISMDQLIGIVVGSVVGGLLLVLLVIAVIGAVTYYRKKSRVTLTFDLNTIKATHITANPAFEDIGREDSGIENDDEITVNKGALEFDDF